MSRVSSPQFSYWLGQAGIVHFGFGQRVLTVVCEIRERKQTFLRGRLPAAADLEGPPDIQDAARYYDMI